MWDIKQKFGQLDTQLQLNFARGMRVVEVVVSGFFDSIGLYDDWGDAQRNSAEQWLRALGLDGHHRALMLRALDHIAQHSDTQLIFVSHSAGERPVCINQYLTFEPQEAGFKLVCRRST